MPGAAHSPLAQNKISGAQAENTDQDGLKGAILNAHLGYTADNSIESANSYKHDLGGNSPSAQTDRPAIG